VKLALFDLDGTLYSSRRILPDAYAEGIEDFNQSHPNSVAVPTESEIFSQVGNPVDTIYRNLFPDLTAGCRHDLQQAIFSSLLTKITEGKGKLFDGVTEVLETLASDRPLAIVTNAQTRYMNAVMETHDLEQYFQAWLCNDDAPNGNKSELVEAHLNRFSTAPENTLLVGDRDSDRKAAETHDVNFIGCRYGYGPNDFPSSVTSLNSITELPDAIRNLS
jgi:phosphoglycolate phosphatase-like HAD superfamily hydrolase